MIKINHVQSLENGIFFYSNYIPNYGIHAYLDNTGNIKTERKTWDGSLKNKNNSLTLSTTKAILILCILMFLSFTGSVFLNFPINLSITLSTFLSLQYNNFFPLCIHFFDIHIRKSAISISKFHSAEHMIFNYYNKFNELPSILELKNSSKFSKDCSLYVIIKKTLLSILFFISYFFILEKQAHILYSICAIFITLLVLFILNLILEKLDLIKYLEVFFLLKPDDTELTVAIKGLESWIELENEIPSMLITISSFSEKNA